MRTRAIFTLLACLLFVAVAAEAAAVRVVVVETKDLAAYIKGVEEGRQLMKSKGSPATIRVFKARFAGSDAGRVVVSVEYPNLETLAKETTRMQNDPDLKKWLASLEALRTVVSDSIYEEIATTP